MIKVIVNADDFGYSRGVNYGIIDAHKYGLVNSATMMMNMPEAKHAFDLASNYPNLALGVHLVLTADSPLLKEDVSSLIQENGRFKTLAMLRDNFDIRIDEVEKEWEAQIEAFLSYGVKPNHFDSHHHIHSHPQLQGVIRKLAIKYNVPVRRMGIDTEATEGVSMYSDVTLFDFYDAGVTENYFDHLPNKVKDEKIVEVMCHPAYVDSQLHQGTSYCLPRLKELEILMNAKLPPTCELVKFVRS